MRDQRQPGGLRRACRWPFQRVAGSSRPSRRGVRKNLRRSGTVRPRVGARSSVASFDVAGDRSVSRALVEWRGIISALVGTLLVVAAASAAIVRTLGVLVALGFFVGALLLVAPFVPAVVR